MDLAPTTTTSFRAPILTHASSLETRHAAAAASNLGPSLLMSPDRQPRRRQGVSRSPLSDFDIGPLSVVIRVINWMVANSKSRTGGTFVPEKTLFLLPNGCQALAPKLNHLIPQAKQAEQIFYGSIPCLGSMVGTDDLKKRAFFDDKVKELCVRMDQMHHELISGQNIAVVNARLCLVSSLNFLAMARTLPPHIVVGPAAEKLYKHMSDIDGICLKLGLPPMHMRLMSAYAKVVFPLTTHGSWRH